MERHDPDFERKEKTKPSGDEKLFEPITGGPDKQVESDSAPGDRSPSGATKVPSDVGADASSSDELPTSSSHGRDIAEPTTPPSNSAFSDESCDAAEKPTGPSTPHADYPSTSNDGNSINGEPRDGSPVTPSENYAERERLLQKHEEAMWKLCLILCKDCRDDADDVFQEARVNVLKTMTLPNLNDAAWIKAVVRNAFFNIRNKNRKHQDRRQDGDPPENIEDTRYGPDQIAEQAEQRRRVRSAIAKLDRDLRFVVELRIDLQLSFKEISEIVGVSEREIDKRWRKALRKLNRLLRKEP